MYNNSLATGNCFLFFSLIVCIFALPGAWKTGPLFWIPGIVVGRGLISGIQMVLPSATGVNIRLSI